MSSLPGDNTRTRTFWRYLALTGVLGLSAAVFACTQDANEAMAPPVELAPAFTIDGTAGPNVSFNVPDALGGGDAVFTSGWAPPTSVGTGVINPFLDEIAHDKNDPDAEEGFNTDGSPFQYDQHRTSDTNALPLNIIPEITAPPLAGTWREFVLDAHEADNDFVIEEFEVYFCDDAAAATYTLKTQVTSNCVPVYEMDIGAGAGPINATDQYSSGSGNVYDYRILIPEKAFEDAFAGTTDLCEYDPSPTAVCEQYIIVWARFSDVQSTYEEFATLQRPQVKVVKTPDQSGDPGYTTVAGNPISFNIVVSNVYGTAEGVMLNDPLPAGGGINWTTSTAGCSVSGSPPAQTLVCDIGSLSDNETFGPITVTSPTTQQSCAVYDNTATVTSTNAGVDDDPGQLEVITCTGTLQLVKRIVNDNGGTATVGAFGIVTNAGTPSFGAGVGDGANTLKYSSQVFTVAGGFAATFSENDVSGYGEGTWSCTGATATGTAYNAGAVTVPAGADVVCTITNDDDAAHLQLVKRIVNDNGGTATVADFGITTSAGTPSFGAGVADGANTLKFTSQNFTVSAGTHTFAEIDVTGYTEGSWSCTPVATNLSSTYNSGSVDLANGESTVCTITNDDDPAHLQLVKRIVNDNGGTATVADFGITTSAGTPSFGAGAADGANTLKFTSQNFTVNAGTHTFAEIDVTGYTEGSWSCTPVATNLSSTYNSGSVDLANGESTVCTITNDDDPAHITLIKRVDNLYGGAATASDFNIQLNGGGVTFGAGSTVGTVTSYSTGSIQVDAGTQTFNEIDFAGYDEGTWSCSPVSTNLSSAYNSGSVDLANGETTTCEITNTEQPPPVEETAYAKGIPDGVPNPLDTQCFIPDFSNWGWTNQIERNVEYVWPVYAGAGGCSGGELAGYVTIKWSGTGLDYSLALEPGFTLVTEHVYAGSTMYPQKDGKPTVAPGQYYIESLTGSGPKWVIYHAIVEVEQ